jgi:uncharacterized protein YbjT (DUF2867 family)
MILVTGATGMFGGRIAKELVARGVAIKGLVRSPDRASALPEGVEPVVGDLDDPSTLPGALEGIDRVFLVTPMDKHIRDRELAMIDAAKAAGVERVLKLYGAVRHRGDELDELHQASIRALREQSELEWSLLSPNTVMETNLLPLAEAVKRWNTVTCCCGDAKIGMVALGDVARAGAVLLHDGDRIAGGENYEITGPEAVTFSDCAAAIGKAIGKEVNYYDMPEDEYEKMLVEQAGFDPETVEIEVMLHFRAFKRGDADVVTDTYEKLTGLKATSIEEWARQHAHHFR